MEEMGEQEIVEGEEWVDEDEVSQLGGEEGEEEDEEIPEAVPIGGDTVEINH